MIRLHPVGLEDAEIIWKMQIQAFPPLLKKYQDYDMNPGAENIEKIMSRMENAKTQYYIIFKNDQAVGGLRLVTYEAYNRISPIFILPEYQGNGYGRAALYQIESICPNGIYTLDTISQEKTLLNLYLSCGYKIVKEESVKAHMDITYFEKHLKALTEAEVCGYLESYQGDHEKSQKSDAISLIKDDTYLMICQEGSSSPYASRVVYAHENKFKAEELLQMAENFYGQNVFGWWLDVHKDQNIKNYLEKHNFKVKDRYDGLYEKVQGLYPVEQDVRPVSHDEEIKDLASLASQIWSYDPEQLDNMIKSYKRYLNATDRRGGYYLVYDNEKAVGYCNYRFSKCQRFMYLTGTGVLESYRHKGYYKALLNVRRNLALKYKAKYVLVQARQGHSSPILRKYGFKKTTEFILMTKD